MSLFSLACNYCPSENGDDRGIGVTCMTLVPTKTCIAAFKATAVLWHEAVFASGGKHITIFTETECILNQKLFPTHAFGGSDRTTEKGKPIYLFVVNL